MKYHFIHERGDYQPLPLGPIYHSWSGEIKNTVNYNESPFIVIYKKGLCRIYSLEVRHNEIEECLFGKINKDKNFVGQIKKKFDQRFNQGEKFVEYLKSLVWKDLSNEEIFKIYDKYYQLYSKIIPYGEPLPYFLHGNLEKNLEKCFEDLDLNDENKKILLTSTYFSFINRQDKDLYNLTSINNEKELNKKLEEHTKKYEWYLFDYASLVSDKKHFFKRFQKLKKKELSFFDVSKVIDDKKRIIEQYKIDKLNQYYIKVLEDLFYLMDRKKEIMTKLHFYIFPAYRELANRLNLDFNLALWSWWSELKHSLETGEIIDQKILKARQKFSVVVCEEGKYYFLPNKERGQMVAEIEEDELTMLKQEIKGMPAYKGKVKGRVCVLSSAKQNNKIKSGEILVVGNTTPDFMPAIRKAKAIVTNEGGITCHAAIVSRELKIPCIVGTRVATKILKDGDLVEVDADKGIIKILNKQL